MDARDIVLSVIGFVISFYGGFLDEEGSVYVVSGILLIILSVWLNLRDFEEDIRILKAQINTQNELKMMWREINDIKNKK